MMPPAVHSISAVPRVIPAVRVTVTVPVLSEVVVSSLFLPLENRPRSVVKITDVPEGTAAPDLSFIIASMVDVSSSSATMLAGSAVNVMLPAEGTSELVISTVTL